MGMSLNFEEVPPQQDVRICRTEKASSRISKTAGLGMYEGQHAFAVPRICFTREDP